MAFLRDGPITLNRRDMRSIKIRERMESTVIDAYAHILNSRGRRGKTFRRFFCTTTLASVAAGSNLGSGDIIDFIDDTFFKTLPYLPRNKEGERWIPFEVEIFYIPVYSNDHYWLITIDMKTGRRWCLSSLNVETHVIDTNYKLIADAVFAFF